MPAVQLMRHSMAAALLALAGGCATITSGTTQSINVDSEPNGAECVLMREGQTLASVTTPGPVTINRHAATIHVTCRKDGYEDARSVMNSRYESASAGNFILGGIIGVMIDNSTGANTRYDSYVMVRLDPAVPGSVRPVRPAPAVEAAATVTPPPGPYDGAYGGGVDIARPPAVGLLRQIELTIAGDKAVGTVAVRACNLTGAISLTVLPSGAVRGEMDLLTAGCGENKAKVDGRISGDLLVLTIDHATGKAEAELSRRAVIR